MSSEETLGRYQITGKLGEGAMGIVYRAFDPLLDRAVAIKTIKLDLADAEQEEFERRFFKEAKSAGRLSHPSIVTVFDAGKAGNVAYIAMELLEGKDLRSLIVKDQLMPVERVVEIVAQVADGLDYAHSNGVVHRDVKPANIMVLDNGTVKIADFGIAQLQSGAKTMTGQVLGTPKYMSPEQIMGKPVDGRSDVFSLGVVLYQMLTGVSPFDAGSVSTIMYRVINEPALMPSLIVGNLPRAFEVILAKALAKQPEKRYQTAAEMAADLRRHQELADAPPPDWEGSGLSVASEVADIGLGGETTIINNGPQIAPPPRKPSRPWLPVGAAVLVAALGILGFSLGNRSTATPGSTAESAGSPAAQAGSGSLALAVTPWGEVFVDGKSAGVTPPLTEIPLPAGRHKLEIRNGGSQPFVLDFELHAGDVRKIKHKFQ